MDIIKKNAKYLLFKLSLKIINIKYHDFPLEEDPTSKCMGDKMWNGLQLSKVGPSRYHRALIIWEDFNKQGWGLCDRVKNYEKTVRPRSRVKRVEMACIGLIFYSERYLGEIAKGWIK